MTPKQRRKRAKRKPRKCIKCSRKFRSRKRNRVPEACTKPLCQTWAAEQRKVNESVARLSAPDDLAYLMGFDLGLKGMSKSVLFGMHYGMGARMARAARSFKRMGQIMQASNEAIRESLDKTMADLFPDSATRPKARLKNVAMQVHDEITYEIEIDEPLTGVEIEIGKVTL